MRSGPFVNQLPGATRLTASISRERLQAACPDSFVGGGEAAGNVALVYPKHFGNVRLVQSLQIVHDACVNLPSSQKLGQISLHLSIGWRYALFTMPRIPQTPFESDFPRCLLRCNTSRCQTDNPDEESKSRICRT